MPGGVQVSWAATGNVADGSAGVVEEAGRGASRRPRRGARGRRGGVRVAVRHARGEFVAARTEWQLASQLCRSTMAAAGAECCARIQAVALSCTTSHLLVAGHIFAAFLRESEEEARRAVDDYQRISDESIRRMSLAGEVLRRARQVWRDAMVAADALRQGRSGGGGQERCDASESVGVGPVVVVPSPVGSTGGAGGDWCGGGERVEAVGSAGLLEVGRRDRAAAGRVPRRALPVEGGRGGWLEGTGRAGPMPAARARLGRVRGARGRRRRGLAPRWQQVGQPLGRPPGCHRGAGCTAGRGKLGKGPWLGDGG